MRLGPARAGLGCFAVAFPLSAGGRAPRASSGPKRSGRRDDYQNANDEFRLLVEKFPKNPDYRVRWGRLYLDHDQAEEATGLFKEALELKKDHAGALLGLALIAADQYSGGAARAGAEGPGGRSQTAGSPGTAGTPGARRQRQRQGRRGSQEGPGHGSQFDQAPRPSWPSMDWLADKKETAWDPHDAADTKPSATSS